jgi:thioredoxin 1
LSEEKTPITKLIPIVRIDCPTCVPILEREIQKLSGVKEVRVNYITKILKVTYDSNLVQLSDIEATIERVGYQIAYKKYPSLVSKLRGLVKKEKPSRVQSISDSDFSGKVLHASKLVAVLFSSPTCPACKLLKPLYIEVAEDLGEKAEFYEMNISSSETWRNYDVLVIPTILVFKEGQVKDKLLPLLKKDEIKKALSP